MERSDLLKIIFKANTGFRDEESIAFLRDLNHSRSFGSYFGEDINLDQIEEVMSAYQTLIASKDYEIFKEVRKNTPETTLILDEDTNFDYLITANKFKQIKKRTAYQSDVYLRLAMSTQGTIPYWEIIAPDLNDFNSVYGFSSQISLEKIPLLFERQNEIEEEKLNKSVVSLVDRIRSKLD